jgi:hypothetical protein
VFVHFCVAAPTNRIDSSQRADNFLETSQRSDAQPAQSALRVFIRASTGMPDRKLHPLLPAIQSGFADPVGAFLRHGPKLPCRAETGKNSQGWM